MNLLCSTPGEAQQLIVGREEHICGAGFSTGNVKCIKCMKADLLQLASSAYLQCTELNGFIDMCS